jgi:hypothetical protein
MRILVSTLILATAASGAGQPPSGTGVTPAAIDPAPRIAYEYDAALNFGVVVKNSPDGKPASKALTYSATGSTNSTVLRIDGKEILLGANPGKWLARKEKIPADPLWEAAEGTRSLWEFDGLRVTQIVQLVPSQQPVEVAKGLSKRLLDTLLVRYRIENPGNRAREVGLRFFLDTMIGDNDGAPFMVAGRPTLIGADARADFRKPEEIPDFVEALEKPDLKDPGTVAHLTLKLGGLVEPPGRVLLTNYARDQPWEIPVQNLGSDSAVVLYWNPRALPPGQTREMGFTYGLGSLASLAGKLGIAVAGSFYKGEAFTVSAYVLDPTAKQTMSIKLPPELQLAEGKEAQELSPPKERKDTTALVTWKVKALRSGTFALEIQSSTGAAEKRSVTIQPGEVVLARPGDTFIDLNWPAPEGMKVAGYRVYRPEAKRPIHGDTLIQNPQFRDLGLSNGQAYVYLVRAVLADGAEWPGYRPVSGVAGMELKTRKDRVP